jgi:toxin YoeB
MRLVFDEGAFSDLAWRVEHDARTARKILALIEEVKRDPFTGKGKPEPLRHALAGCWSRRITQEHRLVYEVRREEVRILSCRFHSRD